MAFKTFHIVQGLSRTPFLFFPRSLTTRFFNNILQKERISKIENLNIWKSKNPGSLTSAQSNACVRHCELLGWVRLTCLSLRETMLKLILHRFLHFQSKSVFVYISWRLSFQVFPEASLVRFCAQFRSQIMP